MREPSVSWKRQRGADGEVHVLVLTFDHGVELQVAGEHGLRLAHWETRPGLDPEVQRVEVARALDWGRAHDEEVRALFKKRLGGASVRPLKKSSVQPAPSESDELRRA